MSSLNKILFIAIVILVSFVILFIYITDNLRVVDKRQSFNHSLDDQANTAYGALIKSKVTFNDISEYNKTFNISSQDLLVLLHIQKTGGTTFERHLVHDLIIEKACSCSYEKRRCSCPRPNQKKITGTNTYETWLISRFSTGWSCGLHADWTQLNECLRGSRNQLFFVTFLRHPLFRFISEFRHVQRGATWKASKSHCKEYNTQKCYDNRPDWQNVTLEEFLSCPHNMAINRQTRMLANHHLLTCPNGLGEGKKFRDDRMLLSAMENLRDIPFVGICEKQRASQLLFEKTFNLKFKQDFQQSEDNKTRSMIEALPNDTRNRILELNQHDLELYNFATNLFESRSRQLVFRYLR